MSLFYILAVIAIFLLMLFFGGLRGMLYTCAPNEVLIFAGRRRRDDRGKMLGFRLIKGGFGLKIPLLESVNRMDLTNMIIDISAVNAYSKGGIPLTVQGVANVKIAGHEPLLNNAIERFLGRSRPEIMQVAKATLEGSLRGILATMTPEQVNEDKILFAERLVSEVEQDMTNLGLVVDTMKIQNVQDEVKYLESLGRQRNAQVVSTARIAEAIAKADSVVRSAENQEREVRAQIEAQVNVAKADAQKRLTDATTRQAAVVAEEQAQVAALVAQAKAEVDVQKARVEQIRRKLEADVIQPAKASAEASEAQAKASCAAIIEDARARADALKIIAKTWREAGPNAGQILLTQKMDSVIRALTDVIPETNVEKVTMVSGGSLAGKAISTAEQIKQVFGIDIVDKLSKLGDQPAKEPVKVTPPEPKVVIEQIVEPKPAPVNPPVVIPPKSK